MERLLTLHVRQSIEAGPPLLTDMNGGFSTLIIVCHAAIVVGCLDKGLSVLRIERVHHVEEILPVRPSAFRKLVREVGHEVSVILELWVKFVDTQFIILRHVDLPLICESEQLLIFTEDHPEKVLVDHGVRGHI